MVQPHSSPVLTVGQPLSSVCPLLVKQGADFILYSTHLNSSTSPLCLWIQVSHSRVLREFLPLVKDSTAALLHKSLRNCLFSLKTGSTCTRPRPRLHIKRKQVELEVTEETRQKMFDDFVHSQFFFFKLETHLLDVQLTSRCRGPKMVVEGGGVCPVKHNMNLD